MGSGVTTTSIDELLDRAVRAINDGDRATATSLAGQVLSVDPDNPEAEDLLAASPGGGLSAAVLRALRRRRDDHTAEDGQHRQDGSQARSARTTTQRHRITPQRSAILAGTPTRTDGALES